MKRLSTNSPFNHAELGIGTLDEEVGSVPFAVTLPIPFGNQPIFAFKNIGRGERRCRLFLIHLDWTAEAS